jgi:hypothetical protein
MEAGLSSVGVEKAFFVGIKNLFEILSLLRLKVALGNVEAVLLDNSRQIAGHHARIASASFVSA